MKTKINTPEGQQAIVELLAQLLTPSEQPEQNSILARAEKAPAPDVTLSKPTRWREPVAAVLKLMNRPENPYTRIEAQNWVRAEMQLNAANFVLLKAAVAYRLKKQTSAE